MAQHVSVLFLSSQPADVGVVRELMIKNGLTSQIIRVETRDEFIAAVNTEDVGVIIARVSQAAPFSALEVLKSAKAAVPGAYFIGLADAHEDAESGRLSAAGADEIVSIEATWTLVAALRRAAKTAGLLYEQRRCKRRERAMARLVVAVQELSLARDLTTVQTIVRRAARDLTGAHGATFVLKDNDRCYYADEDAIEPLWKGQRFPLSACVSGWVMSHRQAVVIEDIYADERVPVEAYRPTFVKSMLMVPIRTESPIGAIGNYWAEQRRADPHEVELLQALANTTAVAMENVKIYGELEQRVKDRTRLLEETNRELEAFSYSVSHDLRSPLSAILGYADLLRETLRGQGDPESLVACERIVQQSKRMNGLIRDLLRLAQVSRTELKLELVDLTRIAREKVQQLAESQSERRVSVTIAEGLTGYADMALVDVVLENLLSNAWKYTGKTAHAQIEFGAQWQPDNGRVFYVRDNGAGFNPKQSERLFAPFQRLHRQDDFPGVGVGLATVQRIVHRLGGHVWAHGQPGEGATFYFTLPCA
jgi:K+-sensing histidine kinase KdpD